MSQGMDDRSYHFVVRHPVIFSSALSSPGISVLAISSAHTAVTAIDFLLAFKLVHL